MFKSKALWWTLLTVWILGATYWHVCRIRLMCDVLANPSFFATTIVDSNGQAGFSDSNLISFAPETDIEKLWQHILMFAGAVLLGFCIGNSSRSRKSRDLKYKLNRILREIEYHQSKQ
ncbi:hypothetical protein [Dyadobacter pollutisoli]|uniref:Uncharacterized protein n=1 Tax=Dyadobacter pollutisoli TaxID=2910158 RepID=A0A9E8SM32_9BACT|nr:hypothetical protein [Dyadobacter pollutisoli]WAC12376.1 hypothetical protein ON006_00135 [Dyadobacter pollutisoli]